MPIYNQFLEIVIGIPAIIAPQTAWGIWLRNAVLGFMTWTGVVDFVQRWFGAAMAKSEK